MTKKTYELVIIALFAFLFFISSPLSYGASGSTIDKVHDYFQDDGKLLFKLRGFYSLVDAKHKKLPESTNGSSTSSINELVENGYGIEAATSFFFTDNFAAELSLGAGFYKVKKSTISEVFNAYGTGTDSSEKDKNLYLLPAAAILQYHVAPYGGLSPYLGLGYHGTFNSNSSKKFKIDNTHGPVLQLGVDLIARDDSFINLDVKQYFIDSRVTYYESFLDPITNRRNPSNDLKTRVRFNPLVFSIGFGYKF